MHSVQRLEGEIAGHAATLAPAGLLPVGLRVSGVAILDRSAKSPRTLVGMAASRFGLHMGGLGNLFETDAADKLRFRFPGA